MSYDISIWHSCDGSQVLQSLVKLGFTTSDTYATIDSKRLRAEVDLLFCEHADLPDEVSSILAATATIELHFTFSSENPLDENLAINISHKLARSLKGVAINHQNGEIRSYGNLKYKSKIARERNSRRSLLEIGWWMDHRMFSDRESLLSLLQKINGRFPELMPKRYGDFEPLQFKMENHGVDHFVNFILNQDLAFTSCTKPILSFDLDVSMNTPLGFVEHWGQKMFRSAYISLCVDSDCLLENSWRSRLKNIWLTICDEVKPFYSEARLVHDYIAMGNGGVCVDGYTENAPIQGPWFAGIPEPLPSAMALGAAYLDLWPSFKEAAVEREGYRYVSTLNWLEDSMDKSAGPPPAEIIAKKCRNIRGNEMFEFPAVFPFSS